MEEGTNIQEETIVEQQTPQEETTTPEKAVNTDYEEALPKAEEHAEAKEVLYIDDETKQTFRSLIRWGSFVCKTLIALSIIMIVAGVINMAMPSYGGEGVRNGISCLLVAILWLIPAKLQQSGTYRIKTALEHNSNLMLNEGVKQWKKSAKCVGIYIIIYFVIIVLAIIGVIAGSL